MYGGKERQRNDVGIVANKNLKEIVVDVKMICDRIILQKHLLGIEVITVINVYASQVGLNKNTKTEF